MTFAYGTPVQTPDGAKPIEDFEVGDPVLAAVAAGGGWQWEVGAVQFSQGTGPGGLQPTMVFIRFGEEGELIVTPDQPMLIAGGRLKRAQLLVPGEDALTAADGSALPILIVSLGAYDGGVHHIATNWDGGRDGKLDGHLLNAAGAICGDYFLQIHQDEIA